MQILAERLLMADRLCFAVRLHRSAVDAVRHRVQVVAVGIPHRADQNVERQICQVADRRDPKPGEAFGSLWTNPPHRPDRERPQELLLGAWRHQLHPEPRLNGAADHRWLCRLRRQLGDQFR